MNRRVVFILVIVFAVMAAITFLQSRQTPPVEIPPENQFASFIGRDLDMTVLDIQAIRLRDPATDVSFTISRDAEGNWTAPGGDGRLDMDAASNIAKTVVLMPYQQTITITDGTDLDDYGFRPDGLLSIEVVLAQENIGHVFAVGSLAPSSREYYVLVDEQPRLLLIQRGAVDYLMAQLAEPPLT